jgi:uncharacterized membrane protein (UPF0127 family)
MARAHFLGPVLRPGWGACRLGVEGRNGSIATKILTAFDSKSRRRGLLGRAGINEGEVLVIAPCSAVHTFRMQFPVDLVYVRTDGRVIKLRPEVGPNRMSGAWGAFCVIEMAAGMIARTGLATGDRLIILPPPSPGEA